MRKVLKYGLKILGGFILVILLLVLLVSLLIQLRPVKNKIAGIAEKQTSQIINGELSIGRLDGNFFTHLSLSNVLLTMNNDTLAYISELDLSYNLLSLLDGVIDVNSATIDRPYIYLEQINDSTWNVQNLTEPGEEKTDTTEAGSINIRLAEFSINNGLVRINSPDTVIPEQIRNLNTNLSLEISDEKQSAEIESFMFETKKPDFRLNQLTLNFKQK
jgi:translocation and assembly module TamB